MLEPLPRDCTITKIKGVDFNLTFFGYNWMRFCLIFTVPTILYGYFAGYDLFEIFLLFGKVTGICTVFYLLIAFVLVKDETDKERTEE
jgi:hypothetical protein